MSTVFYDQPLHATHLLDKLVPFIRSHDIGSGCQGIGFHGGGRLNGDTGNGGRWGAFVGHNEMMKQFLSIKENLIVAGSGNGARIQGDYVHIALAVPGILNPDTPGFALPFAAVNNDITTSIDLSLGDIPMNL